MLILHNVLLDLQRWSQYKYRNTADYRIFFTTYYLETFTQPCAEHSKLLVEQSEEITVELPLKANDIQPLGFLLRFLVVTKEYLEHVVTKLTFFVGLAFRNGMKKRILHALKQANGNWIVVAELLGIGRTILYSKF